MGNVVAMQQPQDLKALAGEFVENRETIKALQDRNKEIARILEDTAEFRPGVMTGMLFVDGFDSVKVARKVYQKWDQKILRNIRAKMGDGAFFKVFDYELKPKDKKTLDGFLAHGDDRLVALVKTALTETPGASQITIKR